MKDLVTYITEASNKPNIIVTMGGMNSMWIGKWSSELSIYVKLSYMLEMQKRLQEGTASKGEEKWWTLLTFGKDPNYTIIDDAVQDLDHKIGDKDWCCFELTHYWQRNNDEYYEQDSSIIKIDRITWIKSKNSLLYDVMDFDKIQKDIINKWTDNDKSEWEQIITSWPNIDSKYIRPSKDKYFKWEWLHVIQGNF